MAKVLRELGGRHNSTNLAWLLRSASGRSIPSSCRRPCHDRSLLNRVSEMSESSPKFIESTHKILFPITAAALQRLLGGSRITFPGAVSTVGWEGRTFVSSSRIAPSSVRTPSNGAGQETGTDFQWPEDKSKTRNLSLLSRIRTLLYDLEEVPVGALGLGLAGAIPFVALTPGVASILPLPEALSSIHVEAQAAYGAVILTFLGGPHWGLAMTDYGRSSTSKLSRQTVQTVRYIWSVVPSLVAWPALLLDPVPKFAVFITSFGLVLGVDAIFAKMGLFPSWYMPLRVLLTAIAMLSLTSSLIVTAASKVVITQ